MTSSDTPFEKKQTRMEDWRHWVEEDGNSTNLFAHCVEIDDYYSLEYRVDKLVDASGAPVQLEALLVTEEFRQPPTPDTIILIPPLQGKFKFRTDKRRNYCNYTGYGAIYIDFIIPVRLIEQPAILKGGSYWT